MAKIPHIMNQIKKKKREGGVRRPAHSLSPCWMQCQTATLWEGFDHTARQRDSSKFYRTPADFTLWAPAGYYAILKVTEIYEKRMREDMISNELCIEFPFSLLIIWGFLRKKWNGYFNVYSYNILVIHIEWKLLGTFFSSGFFFK